jgi:antitoxin ParD1/3/4
MIGKEDFSMTQLQISLPEEAKRFVEEQVASGRYQSPGDYLASLIEQARVQAAKEKLAELIREGMESGEAIEYSDEWWEKRGDEIRGLGERINVEAAKEKLSQLIREGMESGEGEEITDEYWERFDERLAAELKRRQSA